MRRNRKGIISIITMILVMSSFGFCLTYAEPVNQDQITKEATVECNEEIAISADHVKTTDGFVIENPLILFQSKSFDYKSRTDIDVLPKN